MDHILTYDPSAGLKILSWRGFILSNMNLEKTNWENLVLKPQVV